MSLFEISGEKFWSKNLSIQSVIDFSAANPPLLVIDITLELIYSDALRVFFSTLNQKCQTDPLFIFTLVNLQFIARRSRVRDFSISSTSIILVIRSLDSQIKPLEERREKALQSLLEHPKTPHISLKNLKKNLRRFVKLK